MKLFRLESASIAVVFFISIVLCLPAVAIDRLPADSVGEFSPPSGQIAFIRAGDIWIMDANGANQKLVCQVTNAEGRLSWSPDNRQIVFTRSGKVDLRGPDLRGGRHKVYDLFICYLDSAEAGNVKHFRRLTDSLGARGPEWGADSSQVLFWKDMNANRISSRKPNYQLCMVDVNSGRVEPLRADWRSDEELFLVTPSMNRRNEIAFVFFNELMPGGLVVLPLDDVSIPLDSIQVLAQSNLGYVAPSWSPDGNWLAMVGNYPDDSGLYIATADLSTKYLVTTPPERVHFNKYPPSLSPDSKWLTFSTSDGSIWICDIAGNGKTRLTRPGKDQAPCWSR